MEDELSRLETETTELLDAEEFSEAIKVASRALRLTPVGATQYPHVLGRSRAFLGLASWLKSRPATESERRAVTGVDPTSLARLGLIDAQKAAGLQPASYEPYLQQAQAHRLLEKYADAESACLEGLGIEPSSEGLQEMLRTVKLEMGTSRPTSPHEAGQAEASGIKRRRDSILEDVECVLCIKLLYEPVTTPCGHSFCKTCFLRATDHSSKCPMCRTVLHVGQEIPVTLVLRQLIEKSFPEEYEARRREERRLSSDAELLLPLFVMSLILPGERMRLNIFEPRYRLMIRRCMEGSRRFGMAAVTAGGHLSEVACEAEIIECQPVADGRYLLEIEGTRRFKPSSTWEQDGYRMCRAAFFTDDAIETGSEEASRVATLASLLQQKTDDLVARLRSTRLGIGSTSFEVLDLLRHAGTKPAATDYEKLSFWCVNLVATDVADRQQMLSMTSTRQRLEASLIVLGVNPRTVDYSGSNPGQPGNQDT